MLSSFTRKQTLMISVYEFQKHKKSMLLIQLNKKKVKKLKKEQKENKLDCLCQFE